MWFRPGLLLALSVGLVLLVTVRIAQTQRARKTTPRIGFLSGASSEGSKPTADQLRQALKELGWTEGEKPRANRIACQSLPRT
jgi:hypothetical protein